MGSVGFAALVFFAWTPVVAVCEYLLLDPVKGCRKVRLFRLYQDPVVESDLISGSEEVVLTLRPFRLFEMLGSHAPWFPPVWAEAKEPASIC